MDFREILVRALVDGFGDQGFRLGVPPQPTAVFPAKHTDIGDASVSNPKFAPSSIGEIASAAVAVGDILADEFINLDTHLSAVQRAERLTRDVVRFLEHLFADRLVFWQAIDASRSRGWRESTDTGQREPLVSDDRTYDVYLWSGPLPQWRASTAILARGAIRDERDYEILRIRLEAPGESGLNGAEKELGRRLIAEFDRGRR